MMIPIKIYNLGSDKDPVTEEEIQQAMEEIKANGTLPKSWPKKWRYSETPRNLPGTLLIQIGSPNRPATQADIADIQKQLAATVNDPDLIIVTHHNLKLEWIDDGVRTAMINMADTSGYEDGVEGVIPK